MNLNGTTKTRAGTTLSPENTAVGKGLSTAVRLFGLLGLLSFSWCTAEAGDWSRFRGPNGTGVSQEGTPTPTKWGPSENLKWKEELPGPGVSSPIVVGERVFVTSYSGYGVNRNDAGNMEDLKRHLVCIDANTGRTLWDKTVDAVMPEDPYAGPGVPSHGYASHTPVSDGERVFVFFGKTGVLAFDLQGNQLWQQGVGTESDPWGWGSAASPILYKNRLIVTAAAESQALVALDIENGKEIWRQEAAGFDGVWATPALVQLDNGRTELVVAVPYEMWGINPDNGKLRWYCEALESEQINASVVVQGDVIYAIAGRGGGSIAVRAGGRGDVTASHVVWTGGDSGRFGSPVVYEGRLYVPGNVLSCVDIETGKRAYQQRLARGSAASRPDPGQAARGRRGRGFGGGFGRGADYASPVAADGKLYYVRGTGDTYVFKLGDKLEQLAVNRVTDAGESFAATPAISKGRIYLRSDKHLYCVAE